MANNQLMQFKSAFIKDNEIWCVPKLTNHIFRIDLSDWSVKNECRLKFNNNVGTAYVFHQNNVIWCIAIGSGVAEYNILSKEIRYYGLQETQTEGVEVVFYKDIIWFFQKEISSAILYFDTRTKSYSFCDTLRTECKKRRLQGIKKKICIFENEIYIPINNKKEIIVFNLENYSVDIKKCPTQILPQSILKIHDFLYITDCKDKKMIRWNEKAEEASVFCCPYSNDSAYVQSIGLNGEILLISENSADIFNQDTETFLPYDKFPRKLQNTHGGRRLFSNTVEYENKLYLFPWMANMLLVYDKFNQKWEGHIIKIPEKIFFDVYVKNELDKGNPITEVPFKLFFQYITDSQIR